MPILQILIGISIEVLILWFLTQHISKTVRQKGYKSGRYIALTVVLWFAGQFAAGLLGATAAAGSSSQFGMGIIALLGAAVGAGMAYGIANNLAPVDSPEQASA